MKHKLIKNLPKGIAVVAAGAMLFSFAHSCAKKSSEEYESPKFSVSAPVDLSEDDSIKALEKDLYQEPNEASLGIINTARINNLIDKYFKDIDKSNILINELDVKGKKPCIKVRIGKIYNDHSFPVFFEQLNQKFNITILEINSDLLFDLKDIEFKNTEVLAINNSGDFIGQVNLSGFNGLKKLILNKVNVEALPSTVTEITFNGYNHNQYFIEKEINSLKDNDSLCYIEINDVNISDIKFPALKNIYLKLYNCKGYIKLYLDNTENLFIVDENFDSYSNIVVVNGKITKKMYMVSNSSNVFTGTITGNPLQMFVVKFPEGDYIKKPNNIDVLIEDRGRTRKK